MDVTYEWSDVQTQNLHHRVYHELRNGLLGKLFSLLFNVASSWDMFFGQMQQLQCLYQGCTKFVFHYGFSTRLGLEQSSHLTCSFFQIPQSYLNDVHLVPSVVLTDNKLLTKVPMDIDT